MIAVKSGLGICCLVIVVLALSERVDTQSPVCEYHGQKYSPGDAWVDDAGCHVCECNEYGVQCRNYEVTCEINSTIAQPLDTVCLYAQHVYIVGDMFQALDGCNKCLCTERGMQCTAKACSNSGFAQPSKEPLYGECMYDNGWYIHQTQWQARDGCNTCYCYMVGNYRGQHVCTSSTCPCHVNGPLISG